MTQLDITHNTLDLPLSAGPGIDRQLGPALREALFEDDTTLFAVLDGSRIPGLTEKLVAQDLQHTCLFSGEMAQDAAETAPWLVEMHADAPLLRQMLCDVPDDWAGVHGFMRRGAGVLIRTRADMGALRRHLRRFLRVTDATDRAYFFRFWEPDAAAVYFRTIAARTDLALRWMCPRDADPIDALLLPTWLEGPGLVTIRPGPLPDPVPEVRGPFTLAAAEVEALRDLQWRRDKWQLEERLRRTFPDVANRLGSDLAPRVSAVVDRMVGLGFWRRDMLFTFCAWAAHYGADVLDRDPQGHIPAALAQDGSAEDRFALISARMDVLERDYFAKPGMLS